MRSLGILGGTFDPIHFGHLRLALEMNDRLALSDGVRLIPAAKPPLRGTPGTTPSARLEMLNAAVAGNNILSVDDRELQRDGISYTVDTLESLRSESPSASICFILGMDAFTQFHRWHRWRDIVQLAHIAVAKRPGAKFPDHHELSAFVADHAVKEPALLAQSKAGHVCLFDIPALDVSATYVRNLIFERRSARYLVPEAVSQLIEKHGAYRGDE